MQQALLEQAKAADDVSGQWWQLIYNEQIAPAAQWFSEHGWDTEATALFDYLVSVDRAVPAGDAEVSNMISSITLVRGVKG